MPRCSPLLRPCGATALAKVSILGLHLHSAPDFGLALLSRAADLGAELIVMGGYGHSRATEFVLGGFTRTVLASMTVPVLLSN